MDFQPIASGHDTGRPSTIFWRAQVTVWLLLGIAGFFIRLVIFGHATAAFWLTLTLESLAFALTSVAAVAHARYARRAPWALVALCAALLCVLASALLPAIGQLIHQLFPPEALRAASEDQYRMGFIYYMGIFLIWTLIYFGVGAELAARNARISRMKAENRAVQLELEHLQRQVEPHFLFNALNAVVAEIAERPAIAEELTRRLAGYLRYSLDRRGTGLTRLDEELDAVETYIRIQALRYDESLEYRSRVDPAAFGFRLPHMTLQGLVENAIKHGMRVEQGCFLIDIEVRCKDDMLVIEVSNPGHLQGPVGPTNCTREGGLANLSRRLALYYPDRYDFTLTQQADRTVARLCLTGQPVAKPHSEFVA